MLVLAKDSVSTSRMEEHLRARLRFGPELQGPGECRMHLQKRSCRSDSYKLSVFFTVASCKGLVSTSIR